MRPLADRLRGDDRTLLTTFAVERVRNPDLAEQFDRSVIGKKREHPRELIASAIERGNLPPGSDIDLIAEAPAAFLWHHTLYDRRETTTSSNASSTYRSSTARPSEIRTMRCRPF
jgi:Tetracyclin repressor-like, C-terminal domain